MTYLYWFRDDPKRKLEIDIEWATERFRRKFQQEPQALLINPTELEDFASVKNGLNIELDHKIPSGYFGIF